MPQFPLLVATTLLSITLFGWLLVLGRSLLIPFVIALLVWYLIVALAEAIRDALLATSGELDLAMGGAGFLADAPVARLFRDAKLMEIGAGTSEIRRMLVGRELMGAMG